MRNHRVRMDRILSSVILSAYFVVLPLRDEGALSLGISNLPGLFVGSLVLTLVAVPVATLIFSSPTRSKARGSAIATSTLGHNVDIDHTGANSSYSSGWDGHSWFYVSVRIGLFLWSNRCYGQRGATLGQLFGSLFAAGMAWMGSSIKPQSDEQTGGDQKTADDNQGSSPSSSAYGEKHQLWVMFDGLWLILSSTI
ncbi:hypothetical protein AKJ16_DCAP25369 [Drosera capensis]